MQRARHSVGHQRPTEVREGAPRIGRIPEETTMATTQARAIQGIPGAASLSTRMRFLKIALVVFGLIFLLGIYPLMQVWPSGWRWNPNQTEYEQMILGVYATLGIFLILAARNPLQHRSLIWFAIWSSLVHGGIMFVQAIQMPMEHGHMLGDVPALVLAAIVLAALMPRGESAEQAAGS
jgi:Family of unknown function (DUF6632)